MVALYKSFKDGALLIIKEQLTGGRTGPRKVRFGQGVTGSFPPVKLSFNL